MRPLILIALVMLALPAQAQTLLGVARIPAAAKDQYGETLGGFGSAMALVPGTWRKQDGRFRAQLVMLPDRGWNTEGTSDYRARLQRFALTLAPADGAPARQTGLILTYQGSQLLRDGAGVPTTGLDPSGVRPAAGRLPDLPVAANGHVSLDGEGLVLPGDGTAWVSDEYGPYLYHFDRQGRMIAAIRPPMALVPMRGDPPAENFSASSPPHGQTYKVGEPLSGRQNNQGFEGLALSPDRKKLFAILQSAPVQDTDPADVKASRRYTRLLEYDISGPAKLVHEYVVALPLYQDGGTVAVAAESELLAVSDHQFLLLCRDSGGGFTAKRDASLYRKVEWLELNGATDIAGRYDDTGGTVAPKGKLDPSIAPARLTDLLNINDNAQLARFGLHNGPPNDANDLYEKWESMALAPLGDPKAPNDYVLLIGSDNDFITQHGMMAGAPYADASGKDVDTLVMAFRVTLPAH